MVTGACDENNGLDAAIAMRGLLAILSLLVPAFGVLLLLVSTLLGLSWVLLSLWSKAMGELDKPETVLLLLVGFGGLLIGLFMLIRTLDRWTRRLADRIVQRASGVGRR